MDNIIVIIGAFVTAIFLYMTGMFHGADKEKAKQNEKELETVNRACNARTNADIEQLRNKYKRRRSV